MQKKGTKFWGKCVRVGEKSSTEILKIEERKEKDTPKRLASKK
jgi:hypothetical protein